MKHNYIKIISITLTLVLILSLSACGNSSTAFGQFTNAGKEMDKAKGLSMDVTAKMAFNDGEEDVELLLTGLNKINRKSDKDIEAMQDQKLTISGEVVDESQLYYRDEYAFIVAYDETYKGKFLLQDFLASTAFSSAQFEKKLVTEQSTTKTEDGLTEASLKVSPDAVSDFINMGLGSLTDMFGGEAFTFGDVQIVALINEDKNMVSMKMNTSFSIFEDEEKIDGTVELTYENIVIGEVGIDFPADIDSFEEIDFYEDDSEELEFEEGDGEELDLEEIDFEDMEFEDMEIEEGDFEEGDGEEGDSEEEDNSENTEKSE